MARWRARHRPVARRQSCAERLDFVEPGAVCRGTLSAFDPALPTPLRRCVAWRREGRPVRRHLLGVVHARSRLDDADACGHLGPVAPGLHASAAIPGRCDPRGREPSPPWLRRQARKPGGRSELRGDPPAAGRGRAGDCRTAPGNGRPGAGTSRQRSFLAAAQRRRAASRKVSRAGIRTCGLECGVSASQRFQHEKALLRARAVDAERRTTPASPCRRPCGPPCP